MAFIGQDLIQRRRTQKGAQIQHRMTVRDPEVGQVLRKYMQVAEQRRFGRETGPALLLIIDDIDELLGQLDDDAYQTLLWLVKNGPHAQVWVIGSVSTQSWNNIPTHLLDAFHTWLVGHIEPYQTGTNLAQLPVESARSLIPYAQFSLSFNGEWLPFWVPGELR